MESNQPTKRAMDDEESKQATRRVPFAELNQVDSDFAMAMALQEQERALDNALTRIESDSEEGDEEEEEEDDEYSSGENCDGVNDYEFFESQEMEVVEGEDSNSEEEEEEMEEDDIDPDELSYEELMALGEFVGEEKRGLSAEEIAKCVSSCKYEPINNKSGIDRCVICQVEYEGDESLVALPCDHPYHSECITNWLQIKKTCPICSFEVSSSKIVR